MISKLTVSWAGILKSRISSCYLFFGLIFADLDYYFSYFYFRQIQEISSFSLIVDLILRILQIYRQFSSFYYSCRYRFGFRGFCYEWGKGFGLRDVTEAFVRREIHRSRPTLPPSRARRCRGHQKPILRKKRVKPYLRDQKSGDFFVRRKDNISKKQRILQHLTSEPQHLGYYLM